ncbi:MAG TPA: Cj0069 family protein [Chitinophagaceae bacterium]|nr:Cj0069 family protein [Chitinophagaceae bacterium]
MIKKSIALLVYGDAHSVRDALTEEKYKDLAAAFSAKDFTIRSVSYNDDDADKLGSVLLNFDAILVWVNPIEQGKSRKRLDRLLCQLSDQGRFVSTHPEVILKMGTKDILYKTKDMDWGGDTKMYSTYEDFTSLFPKSLQASLVRVLKQHRGNGGNGVYKIRYNPGADDISLVHAKESVVERTLSWNDFFQEFSPFFTDGGMMIDQEWNKNMKNGMVRCYLSGKRVAGFGYQEINALYELNDTRFLPGKRYYFTENCGLFHDLAGIMEKKWVGQLQKSLSIADNMMPVIWDADFFINNPGANDPAGKYMLCEINVSCVSPFPPSAIKFMVEDVTNRI